MSFIRPVALNKSRERSGMARRPWRRRSIVIGAVIVVLSIGIVFASLPYLQPPTTAHGSITGTLSHVIGPADSTLIGFYGLKLPNITATESFFVGVSVANGTARIHLQYTPILPFSLGQLHFRSNPADISGYTEVLHNSRNLGRSCSERQSIRVNRLLLACITHN